MVGNLYSQSHRPHGFGDLDILVLGHNGNPYGGKTPDQRTIIDGLGEFAHSAAVHDYWNVSYTPDTMRSALSRPASGLSIVYFSGSECDGELVFPFVNAGASDRQMHTMSTSEFLGLLDTPAPKVVFLAYPNSDFGCAPGNTLMVGISGDRLGSFLDALLADDIRYAAHHPQPDSLKVFLATLRSQYHNRPLPFSDDLEFIGVDDLYKMYCLEKATGQPMIQDSARIFVRSNLVIDGSAFQVDPSCNFQ